VCVCVCVCVLCCVCVCVCVVLLCFVCVCVAQIQTSEVYWVRRVRVIADSKTTVEIKHLRNSESRLPVHHHMNDRRILKL